MKPKSKILSLTFGLMLPYMALVFYLVLRIPQHPLPLWFRYFAPCYFVGSIVLITVVGKRLSRTISPVERAIARPKAIIAARRLGYIWLIGPVLHILSGRIFTAPLWLTALGFTWVGLLSGSCFYLAKKLERQNKLPATS